jgi:hypothetical protein
MGRGISSGSFHVDRSSKPPGDFSVEASPHCAGIPERRWAELEVAISQKIGEPGAQLHPRGDLQSEPKVEAHVL